MEKFDSPAWLETLWNINPSLAERAEKDVQEWQKIENKLHSDNNEALERPNIKDYCSDASLRDMHSVYVSNQGIWQYLQALDAYCDELEKLHSGGKPDSDTEANDNKHDVIKSVCPNCRSSSYSETNNERRCKICHKVF